MIRLPLLLLLLIPFAALAADRPAAPPPTAPPPNTWVAAKPAFELPADLKDARWATGDGYSDSVYRSKTGGILIRTGIHSDSAVLSPGFYTNTTVEWDLKTGRVAVVEVSPWGGGSYGHGSLPAGFAERPAPSPRHTYDGICYVEPEDAVYLVLGANARIGGTGCTEEAKAALKPDMRCTWKYSFADRRWSRIDSNPSTLYGKDVYPYEAHLAHWPEAGKLLFIDGYARNPATFDLKAGTWEKMSLKNKPTCPMYNSRSTWDSKRQLWVFRLGAQVGTFDPRTAEFGQVSPPYEQPAGKDDPRGKMKGIAYISAHDVYLINGPTGADTHVYSPQTGKWSRLDGGDLQLINGYLQYDPKTDHVVLSYQHTAFVLRYTPGK